MALSRDAGVDPNWALRLAEAQSFLARGQAIEAMKVLMEEMREFSMRQNVSALPIDTSKFYSKPAEFAVAFKAVGAAPAAVRQFSELLAERGMVFLKLAQPARALQDLQAAVEIFESHTPRIRDAVAQARSEVSAAIAEERRVEDARKVPITVLTGFLGAGKTTLLNYILHARHGRKYAVIENEVGKIGIDNQLLEDKQMSRHTSETVTLLDNGCLCCTVRSDLITAIKQILERVEMQAVNERAAGDAKAAEEKPLLDGILIETTGLADPGPVCKTFYADEQLRARTRMDGVLTVVDALHFSAQLRRVRSNGSVNESAQQVGFADKLLLNKVDTVPEDKLQSVEAEIRSINQVCPIYRCSLARQPDQVPLDELLGSESFSLDRVLQDLGMVQQKQPMPQEPPMKRARSQQPQFCKPFRPVSRHDSGVMTCAIDIVGAPMILERFMQVMNSIRAENAVDLYRYKGVVCVKETSGALKRAVLQGVHDMCVFEPRGSWPSDCPKKTQIVFIGRNLDEALWGRLFEKAKEGILDERVA